MSKYQNDLLNFTRVVLSRERAQDEALLQQALKTLEQCYEALPLIFAKDIEPVIDTLKERLK